MKFLLLLLLLSYFPGLISPHICPTITFGPHFGRYGDSYCGNSETDKDTEVGGGGVRDVFKMRTKTTFRVKKKKRKKKTELVKKLKYWVVLNRGFSIPGLSTEVRRDLWLVKIFFFVHIFACKNNHKYYTVDGVGDI